MRAECFAEWCNNRGVWFGSQVEAHPDPFLCSMAHWVLEDYSSALDTLLQQPAADPGSPGIASETSRSLARSLPLGLSRIHFIYP